MTCVKLHAIRGWHTSGNTWFADPTAIGYQTVIRDPKSRGFHSFESFFYMACPKPGAQFEIVSWVRKNESDGENNLNSDFEIPEKELKGRAFHV